MSPLLLQQPTKPKNALAVLPPLLLTTLCVCFEGRWGRPTRSCRAPNLPTAVTARLRRASLCGLPRATCTGLFWSAQTSRRRVRPRITLPTSSKKVGRPGRLPLPPSLGVNVTTATSVPVLRCLGFAVPSRGMSDAHVAVSCVVCHMGHLRVSSMITRNVVMGTA